MHHIFVNENSINLSAKKIVLLKNDDEETFNHLVKSLRISVSEKVLCSAVPFKSSFDYLCDVVNVSNSEIVFSILEETTARELPVKINLYQGVSKFDKLEFIIEKAVELGVNTITPLKTKYCIAKIDEKNCEKKMSRWSKIAKSASEQSKRHIIPEVKEPLDYDRLMEKLKADLNASKNVFTLLFYENANGINETREVIGRIKEKLKIGEEISINVIIGAEGGFSEEEIELAKKSGLDILSLGDRILRTETASVTALSILMYEMS